MPRAAGKRGFWPRTVDLSADLRAGLTVALVSVAEGMAYALVAGVNPVFGLYAGSVTVIVGSLLSSSTLLMVTATNALALVTADRIGALGADVDPVAAMATLTLLVGVVMAVLGLLRLGSLVRFISAEVQAGLVAAVAVLIVLGQLDELVGYRTSGGGKVRQAVDTVIHPAAWNWPTVAVGFGCVAVLVVVKRTRLRSSADIAALILGTLAVAGLGLDSVATVADIADIPTGLASLPVPHLPDFSLVPALAVSAVAAAIVGLSEAATVGSAYPNPDGRRSEVSRDFLAQGVANIAGGLVRALPSGGSLSRTGVNQSAGARSRWSGVFAGVLLLVLVAVAGSLAELIPMATLAAILVVIGVETLVREVRRLVLARWVSRPHLVAAALTVVIGVVGELTTAILVGVGASLLLFTLSMADRLRIVAWVPAGPGVWREVMAPQRLEPGTVTVLALTGSAYFASTYSAAALLPDLTATPRAAVVLQLRGRRFYSLTGIDALNDLVTRIQAAGHVVLLADVEPSQRAALQRTHVIDRVGEGHLVWREDTIGAAATVAAARARAELASAAPADPPAGNDRGG